MDLLVLIFDFKLASISLPFSFVDIDDMTFRVGNKNVGIIDQAEWSMSSHDLQLECIKLLVICLGWPPNLFSDLSGDSYV